MLKLSRKVCGQRAAARDVHEGGLHGHTTAVYQAGKWEATVTAAPGQRAIRSLMNTTREP